MLWLYLQLHLLSKGFVRAFSNVSRTICHVPPLAPFSYHAYKPMTKHADNIHEVFDLQRVVVIHRHGDRSQINAELGIHFPAGRKIDEFWQRQLPTSDWETALAR